MLNIDSNAKTVKGIKRGYSTGILYLAPSNESGIGNVCPNASAGCKASCLYKAGRGNMPSVIKGRIRKTVEFFNSPELFMAELFGNICMHVAKAKRKGNIPCVRLNGTSDIDFNKYKVQNKSIYELLPSVQFYDYTKNFTRMKKYLAGKLSSNYHLTFSRSENNDKQCKWVLEKGGNVAIVFRGGIPDTYMGYKVINGDKDDLRFLDDSNVIVGLSPKGKAKKDISGFVINI